MKRIKILLTATAVFAVVGGALAFKAVKSQRVCYYTSSTSSQSCPLIDERFSITVADASAPFAKTLVKGANPCPTTAACTVRARIEAEN